MSAKPGSSFDAITAVEDDYVGVSVKAPPKEGQANDGIKEYLAEVLDLKKRDLSIVKGEKSSDKIICIDEPGSFDVEEVIKLLKAAM